MPFTLAHTAFVLPILNKPRLSQTGLIIGSMVPDFEFFIQMREVPNIGHQWLGVLLFDIPFALFMCFFFHNIIRDSFIKSLPETLNSRMSQHYSFDWNNYFLKNTIPILLSICVGICSHFLMDSFTHHDGFMVKSIPLLSRSYDTMGNYTIYFLLQIFLSIIGLIIVIGYIPSLPKRKSKKYPTKYRTLYWTVFLFLFIIILGPRLLLWPHHNTFGGVLIAIMGAATYSWVSLSIIFKIKFSKLINYATLN